MFGFTFFAIAENVKPKSVDEQAAGAIRDDNATEIRKILNWRSIPSVISYTYSKSIVLDSNVLHLALDNDSAEVLKLFIENSYDISVLWINYNLIEYATVVCASKSFEYLITKDLRGIDINPNKLASIATPECPDIFHQIRKLYPEAHFEVTITEEDNWAEFFKSTFVTDSHRNIFVENGSITITMDDFVAYWPKINEHRQYERNKPKKKFDPLTLPPNEQIAYALENDDVKWLEKIIEYNEIPQIFTATGTFKVDILELSAVSDSTNSLMYLISEGYDPFLLNERGENLLSVAATSCTVDSYFLLKDLGLDINHKDKFGRTALHHAVLGSCEEIYNDLISAGAKDFTLQLDDGRELTSREFLNEALKRNELTPPESEISN